MAISRALGRDPRRAARLRLTTSQGTLVGYAEVAVNVPGRDGAQERTRTSTAFRPLAPEASASTNSATWAQAALDVRAQTGIVNRCKGGGSRLRGSSLARPDL